MKGECIMRVIIYEMKKVFCIPALWGFLLLGLAFNTLLICGQGYERDYFHEMKGAEQQAAFTAEDNVFAGYDTGRLALFYADIVKESPSAVRCMERKYALLQPRVEQLAECGAALDHYAGNATYESHQFLYNSLMRAVLAEGCMCAVFVVLYLMGYEQLNHTEGQVCTSRMGRGLWTKKMTAAIVAAVVLYFLTVGVTLLLYFALWDYSGIWRDSVSSRFNYLTDLLYVRPFITWHDFTVVGYLAAVLMLGAALVAVFALMAAVCVMVVCNVYGAALVIAVILFGGLGLGSLFSQWKTWVLYFVTTMQPAAVWLSMNVWFTESGISTFMPWQETLSTALNLIVYGIAAVASLNRFRCRDIA